MEGVQSEKLGLDFLLRDFLVQDVLVFFENQEFFGDLRLFLDDLILIDGIAH